jgi:succinate dehydrogenase / fumarate reductase cytochrome b subunit
VERGVSKQSFLVRNDFLLRRLHSISGIVPIGVFLIAHLTTNSSILWGKAGLREHGHGVGWRDGGVQYFQKEVTWINEQVPHLLLIELTLWISIAFHSIYGLYIARTGRSNVANYDYCDNWRYTLQRISGYIGIVFIFYHVATLRWGWSFLVPGGTKWSAEFAASTLAAALRGSTGEGFTLAGMLVTLGYLIGVTLLVFHFANGLWTAAITWGVTISREAQRRWGRACLALGAGLMVMAWGSVIGFATLKPAQAARIEKRMGGEKVTEVTPAAAGGDRAP